MSPLRKSPFKLHYCEEGLLVGFEAEFPLPYDDTPDAKNVLLVRALFQDAANTIVNIELFSRTSTDKFIGEIENIPVTTLGNILYGFARLKTVTTLDFGGAF